MGSVVGNVISVTDTDSELAFIYDSVGRLITAVTNPSGNAGFLQPTVTLRYSYDANGNRVQLVPSGPGAHFEYTYDALNRVTLTRFQNSVGKSFQYDALSRLTRISGGGGMTSDYAYDAIGQLQTIAHKIGTNTIATLDYTYDSAGNRSSMTDRFGLHGYGYDALYQLTSASHPAASALPNESFAYDAVGNRTVSHLSASHTHNAANRLLEDATYTYTYDANGNLTTKTDKTTLGLTSNRRTLL